MGFIKDIVGTPKAAAPRPVVESAGYQFGKPFVREDPAWYNFGTDPLFWLLEKVTRPQSALFGYMDATLRGESGWQAIKDALGTGKRPEVYEILDNMGLKGQAGKFDPVEDTIGFMMELFLDPVNLMGVGPLSKFGKLGKITDVAGDVAKTTERTSSFIKTIDKIGGIEKLVEQGIVPPGELGERVVRAAEKMMGPDAFSHYLNLGWGKYQVSIPGSNIVLEKALIGPAKAVRRGFKDILSTIPESHDEAILKALMDTSERVISGAEKNIANVRRIVGAKWASKLSQAVEAKSPDILKGAPDKVMIAYDDLVWFGKYAPEVEKLSGVMTKGLGEAAGEAKTLAAKLDAHGLDDEAEQLGYILHAVTKDAKEYIYKNDIRSKAKKPKGWSGPHRPKHLSQLPREIPGAIADINSRYAPGGAGKFILHPRGELEGLYLRNPVLRSAINDIARAFDAGLDQTSKVWPKIRADLQRIGEGLGSKAKAKGEMSETAYNALWKNYLDSGDGQKWAKNLFKDASHRQHFDKFMEDDALRLLAARTGRHYRARTIAETIGQIMDHPEWAVPIKKIPREYADDIPTGIAGLGDDVEDIPDGFRLLDIEKIENYLTPEFANRIRNTAIRNDMAVAIEKGVLGMFDVRDIRKGIATYRRFMGYARAATILPFAGYHVANKFGNMWWRFVGGTLDPRNDIDAFKLIGAVWKNDRKALEKMSFNLGKRKMNGLELRNAIEQYDVATGGFLTEAAGGGPLPLGAEIGDSTKWYELHKWLDPTSRKQIGSKVARGIEDEDRIAHFIGKLRKGNSLDDASRSVDTYLFRYSDLTEFEAGTQASVSLLRDQFMFYTWYRKNLGLTMQKVWEYPGRLSMPIKIRHALDGIFGDPDSEYAVPSYMRDSFYLYLGKNKEGMPRFLDPEKYLPPISAAQFGQGGLAGVGKQIGSMLVPLIKAPLEFATDTEFFSGRSIEGAPGQVTSIFGREFTNPMWGYAIKNTRILNTLNKILFPRAELPGGQRLTTGQAGKRPPGATGKAILRDWVGIRTTDTNPQLARHMEGVSKNGRIGKALNQIESKMANSNISPKQRNSFMNERTKLLWEKAEILGEIVADGTDPFTGKSMKWVKDKSIQGQADEGSLRSYYNELQTTLRDLYFGNKKGPLDHGIIVLEPLPRLSPEETQQAYDMFRNITGELLKRNTEWAIEKKDGDYYRSNVLDKVKALIKTEEYYSPQRIRRRKSKIPKSDIIIYNYPYEFRKALADSYRELLLNGARNRLIKRDSYRRMWESFYRDYGVDYRE